MDENVREIRCNLYDTKLCEDSFSVCVIVKNKKSLLNKWCD